MKCIAPTDIFNEVKNVSGYVGPSITIVKKWAVESKRGHANFEV